MTGTSSSGSNLRTALVPSGLIVRIAGTSIRATVEGSGRFTLDGVPPGDVQLVFEGAGINASLVLSGLRADEDVTIVVALKGNSAVLEADSRHGSVDDDSADDDSVDDDSVDDDSADDDSADDDSADDDSADDDSEDDDSEDA